MDRYCRSLVLQNLDLENGNVLECRVSSWLEMASNRTEYIWESDWSLQVINFSHSGSLGSVSECSRWERSVSPAALLV